MIMYVDVPMKTFNKGISICATKIANEYELQDGNWNGLASFNKVGTASIKEVRFVAARARR